MNKQEFSGIENKILASRGRLESIQNEMNIPGQDDEKIALEKATKLELDKWLMVEENILKQKSRIQWLKLRDSNIAYYHACMKNRQVRNNVDRLVISTGQILQSPAEVEEEILSFYKGLLGTAAKQFPVVNPEIMQNGHILSRRQQLQLIKPVTREEVKQTIMDIDDNKALGCDGYNSYFFKKTWHILGEEVTAAVQEFFENADMCKAVNCTTITLIPTIHNPINIRDFRPISYYNILMSHELVKGYGRKNISPRCMLKIDMHKAYDSVEWVYIEQELRLLNFPAMFVKRIMACIRTVSYSVLINGKPSVPFEAKKA
uniref:Reverse transcriptase domain-containing protein n=1 Tax=Nicotiana tabacum TaxID=4097 RepID=A0A1S3ZIC8_TOBAC|nr:PREDICTED: uncharacterized protein LOC107787086 [Nicotiana tabacum]